MNAGRCKSCGASIWWARTERGKSIPLDALPDPAGNITLELQPRGERVAVVHGPLALAMLPEGVKRWKTHFVGCKSAAQHRRRA